MLIALNTIVKKATGWLVAHNFRESEVDLIRNKFERQVDKELNAIVDSLPITLGTLIFQPQTLPVVSGSRLTAYGSYVLHDIANKFLVDADALPDYENFCALKTKYGNRLDRMLPVHSALARDCAGSAVRSKLKGYSEWGTFISYNSELFVLTTVNGAVSNGVLRFLRAALALHIYQRDYMNTRYSKDESVYSSLVDNVVQHSCLMFEVVSFNAYKKVYDTVPKSIALRMRTIRSKMTNYTNGTFDLGDLND